ncbi:hypothetical protein J4T99_gp022 [Mycobacterium phage Bromden]|uniref:Uncharacterized protein n=1 Tax=Mycobacterium phage Bromden TaxID=2283252 RepID=A0A345MBF7_9CAUD|nr:hypothetical protein J4T99_gp022 [Mycobacterium phage Bromden]AXH67828.1 hypothetical protein SEA_BROMDEN_22 [Mycobacterium phage Bromden]
MPEFTQTVTVKVWRIGTFEDGFGDWPDLVKWCSETEGMTCTMAAKVINGPVHVQVEGATYPTVYPPLGSYLAFNGFGFEVLTEDEFASKYGAA